MPKTLMTKQFKESFVARFASKRQIYMDIAERHGSPVYVFEPDVLIERAETFRQAFVSRLPKTAFFYAMKSNNYPLISKLLADNGYGIDVSSGMELNAALSTAAEKIIFSGPGKTREELVIAIENASRVTILVDSFGELEKLKELTQGTREPVRIGVRINNNPSGLWRKFGIPLEKLELFFDETLGCPGLKFTGLQFHSSWNMDPDRQVEFVSTLGAHLRQMPDALLNAFEFVDIGGGYWPPSGEWLITDNPLENQHIPAKPIDFFADALSEALKTHILSRVNCIVCFEPGRWICNDAMHILLRVIDKKDEDLVITDGGTNIIGWERFETDYFPVINLSRFEMTERPCHILGALCTPHDVWGYAYFGESIGQGDILMVPTQGAYTYSLRQQFIKPLAKVVVRK